MYGLIVENVLGYLRSHFHPKRYQEIKTSAKLTFDDPVDITKVYPEGVIPRIGKKASMILQVSEKEIFEGVGVYFVGYYKRLGYRETVARIGRYFREFVFNLDNCHDYFKLTFTRMRAPSFFVEHEHEGGMRLIYRSKRRGFTHYVVGQMKEIAHTMYGLEIEVEIKRQEIVFDTVIVTYNMRFDNSAYIEHQKAIVLRQEASLPIKAMVIFEIFPFAILFNDKLVITLVGSSLRRIMPSVIGQSMNACFGLVRPLMEFTAEQIMQRTNNVFVFQSLLSDTKIYRERRVELSTTNERRGSCMEDDSEDDECLQLRGTVTYMPMWKKILFLGCPIINGMSNLVSNGLFINDLSMHDYSRDLVITSTQQMMEDIMTKKCNSDITDAIGAARSKTAAVAEENDRKLVSSIPKQLELGLPDKRVKKLEFGAVMLATIDRFDHLCRKADPVDLIELMDDVSAIVDHLVESLGALRVETERDFMAISDFTACLGEDKQTERMATMALDLENAARVALREPFGKRNKPVKFRIVVLTGPLVYAVVGRRLPKFCVFGPTVAAAEMLLDMCPPDKILSPEVLTFRLPPDFKYSKVQKFHREDVDCVYLDGREDHRPIPVMHIVQAYGAFKVKSQRNKQRALMAGTGTHEHLTDLASSLAKESKTKKRKKRGDVSNGDADGSGHSVCNGFLAGGGSRACSIL